MPRKNKDQFTADRFGHNGPIGSMPSWGRICYMAHASGYVMARRPGCTPFAIQEKLWLKFKIYDSAIDEALKSAS